MKHAIYKGLALVALGAWSVGAEAATFAGYSETGDIFYDDVATFDYDPVVSGGAIFDPAFLVDVSLSTDLGSGFLLLTDSSFATVLDGFLLDTMLSVDNDIADDTFSMLFELTTGPTSFAIATFTGNLDGFGFDDFFTVGVLFEDGGLKIVGASQDGTPVIPLPAGLPLLLAGIGTLAVIGRKTKGMKSE